MSNFLKLFPLFFLVSCATMHAQNCTENAGYEKGFNDAKMGRMMFLNQFAVFCKGKDIELAQKGYKDGYENGKKEQGTPQLNLSFKNGKVGLVGAYKCSLNNNGEQFSAEESTEVMSRNKVVDACNKKFKLCNEQSVSCTKN